MMKKLWFLAIGLALCTLQLDAQKNSENNPVIFTYGDKEVTKSEFKYVFEKNNPEIEDPTVQDLKDYLDLYINFKLKVKAAEDAQIDTVPSVRNDLKNYLNQLYQSYLDKVVLNPLMEEVKERWVTDVRASHILVRVGEDASPEDTLAAYNKIMKLRQRILSGEDFGDVAMEESEDRYAKQNKGDIGYVAALVLPFYKFESTLYNTEVGEVSMPVRTKLGYHIINPTEKREAMGTVQVAHLLVKLPPDASEEEVREAREKINTIYQKLQEGEDFGMLARKYSDDEMTKSKGGEMQPFATGQMVPQFENKAFSLEGDSSFTEPFRTRYGFHILMLLDKTEKTSFEQNESRLRSKVKKDQRYELMMEKKINRFKSEYNYTNYGQNLQEVTALMDSSLYEGSFTLSPDEGANVKLFEIGGKDYTLHDFLNFIVLNQRYAGSKSFENIAKEQFPEFKERIIMETAFRDKYPDYPRLKQEYHDGIMMFAMMQDSVWNRALKDTAGLEAYYEKHKGKYEWGKRLDATAFYIYEPGEVNLKKLKKQAKKYSAEEMMEMYNDSTQITVDIDSLLVEKGINDLIDTIAWKKGWSEKMPNPKGDGIALVKVNKLVPPQPKTLSEARGAYIADYQSKLEKEWVATLRNRYTVKVNEEILKTLAE